MKWKIFCLAGMLAACVFWTCGCSEPLEPTSVLLHKAMEKASEGDWTGADSLAGKVLKQDKNNADALMLRALARNSLDSRDEAAGYAIHAARLKPDLFLAQYIQGMLLSKNGKPELALRALKEARRIRPEDVNTLILLAENSIAIKRYKEAAGYFKILAKNPNYRTSPYLWNGLGICYAARSPQLAVKFFQMAERFSPNDPVTVLNLAVLHDAHLRQGRQAQNYYDRFIRITAGKTEYDTVRSNAEFRLDSIKGR